MGQGSSKAIYVLAGATSAGALRGKLESNGRRLEVKDFLKISGVHIDAELLVGTGLVISGLTKKYPIMTSLGTGMLCNYAGEFMRRSVLEGKIRPFRFPAAGDKKKGS